MYMFILSFTLRKICTAYKNCESFQVVKIIIKILGEIPKENQNKYVYLCSFSFQIFLKTSNMFFIDYFC